MNFPFFNKRGAVRELNDALIDALTFQQIVARPNRFSTKRPMVAAVAEKYRGTADRGNQVVQRIVNLRAAFVLTEGVGIEGAGAEADFLAALLDHNDLNESLAVELVKETEIEGQALVRLVWNPAVKNVEIKFVSWLQTDYRVVPDPGDFTRIQSISFDDGARLIKIDPAEAVFIKFNTRINSYEGYPAVGAVLRECEDVDAALSDWRRINGLFAKMTPYFRVPDERAATLINERIAKSGWRLGTAFASSAEFSLVGPSVAPAEMIEQEIATKMKIIAGATGVGIHHLGFADVMSNRSTAESLQQPVELASRGDQTRWRRFYEELFAKAIRLRNRHLNGALDETAVKPKLTKA